MILNEDSNTSQEVEEEPSDGDDTDPVWGGAEADPAWDGMNGDTMTVWNSDSNTNSGENAPDPAYDNSQGSGFTPDQTGGAWGNPDAGDQNPDLSQGTAAPSGQSDIVIIS